MKIKFLFIALAFISVVYTGYSQSATIKGIILDEHNMPVSNVNIKTGNNGTQTNINGFYILKIPANQDVNIQFTHLSFKKILITFNLKNGEVSEFNPVMSSALEQIGTIIVNSKNRKEVEGVSSSFSIRI